jgi:hypothetical protein
MKEGIDVDPQKSSLEARASEFPKIGHRANRKSI